MVGVSIHTPTWGVTEAQKIIDATDWFQSTHLHEVWLGITYVRKMPKAFQSTHLHEVWRRIQILWKICQRFNPHTYMRCDAGCTITERELACFNPHTYMRCDKKTYQCISVYNVSIHTPTWGVTLPISPGNLIWLFQSTHLHEVWLQVIADASDIDRFNPHTYMRCD